MKRKLILLMSLLLLFTACAVEEETPEEPTQEIVTQAEKGDYQVLAPYKPSPLRQTHAVGYREADVVEIGRRLLSKSKEHFSTDKYFVAEGQVIDIDRYYDYLSFKSDTNPEGLMTKYDELEIDGTTLYNPIFVSDLYEYNFHHFDDAKNVQGVSIALVLRRLHVNDKKTGSYHRLSDEALFNIGQAIGIQLAASIRSIEGMASVPIYIGLYAQTSEEDKLPNNYLPGSFIGDGFSKDRSFKFSENSEKWIMLSDSEAIDLVPEVRSDFYQLKSKITSFVGDETIGFVGRAFVVEDELGSIRLEVNANAKTYLELYGLAQYITQEVDDLGKYDVDVKVDIRILGNMRVTIVKEPGAKATMTIFE